MSWPASGQKQPDCDRLRNWLSDQDALSKPNQEVFGRQATLDNARAHAQVLSTARRPLIWIESADVSATRAAIQLAEVCQAKVHVAQSPGAANVSAVTAACGTFTTSLAEVSAHADLVIHLGHRHLQELPRLGLRFLHDNAHTGPGSGPRHVLIGDDVRTALINTASGSRSYEEKRSLDGGSHTGQPVAQCKADREPLVLAWPRDQWLDQLTRLLMVARGASVVRSNSEPSSDSSAADLAEQLAASRYAVFMWDEDEFADELDRLLIERLFEIAQHYSRVTRCSLLPLSSDPGRVTAKETVLWLTNVAGTARFTDGQWRRPTMGLAKSLHQWQREHDWILCVRNLPSDRPLPNLRFDFTIDALCNQRAGNIRSGSSSPAVGEAKQIAQVAAVGLETAGHLFRLDHAYGVRLAPVSPSDTVLTAERILRELARTLIVARRS